MDSPADLKSCRTVELMTPLGHLGPLYTPLLLRRGAGGGGTLQSSGRPPTSVEESAPGAQSHT